MDTFGYLLLIQNESRQLYAMEKNGIKQKNIFVDKQSGKNFERKQYKALLRKLKEEIHYTLKALVVSGEITLKLQSSGAI